MWKVIYYNVCPYVCMSECVCVCVCVESFVQLVCMTLLNIGRVYVCMYGFSVGSFVCMCV